MDKTCPRMLSMLGPHGPCGSMQVSQGKVCKLVSLEGWKVWPPNVLELKLAFLVTDLDFARYTPISLMLKTVPVILRLKAIASGCR